MQSGQIQRSEWVGIWLCRKYVYVLVAKLSLVKERMFFNALFHAIGLVLYINKNPKAKTLSIVFVNGCLIIDVLLFH